MSGHMKWRSYLLVFPGGWGEREFAYKLGFHGRKGRLGLIGDTHRSNSRASASFSAHDGYHESAKMPSRRTSWAQESLVRRFSGAASWSAGGELMAATGGAATTGTGRGLGQQGSWRRCI